MSLIKSQDTTGAGVQGLSLRRPAAAPVAHPLEAELARGRTEIAALREALAAAVAAAEAEAKAHASALVAAAADALATGRAEGRYASDQAAATLKAGLDDAAGRLAAEFAGLERLAVSLAHEGLARILQNPDSPSALVREALVKQVRALEANAILDAEVSSADFPGSDSLQDLTAALGASGVTLRATDDLPSGGCRLRLKLGQLDLGLGQQWSRLSEIFESLGLDEAAS